MKTKQITNIILLVFAVLFLSSCINRKELVYFQDQYDESVISTYEVQKTEKRINPYDKLNIQVYSLDERVNALFNQRNTSVVGNDASLISYTVNNAGFIDFPYTGQIKVSGLTLEEAKDKIQKQLDRYLAETSIIVRFIGSRVTILGQVRSPGEYIFNDEKINVLQALSHAGGIAQYGNKSDIKIIREGESEFEIIPVDLTKSSIIGEKNFFLQPNDIVIVNPVNQVFRTYRDFNVIYLMMSLISTAAIIIGLTGGTN